MRAKLNPHGGGLVYVSRAEVARFRRSWPCSGLPDKPFRFDFDRRHDLVDMRPELPESLDGGAALALSDDAEAHLARQVVKAGKVPPPR